MHFDPNQIEQDLNRKEYKSFSCLFIVRKTQKNKRTLFFSLKTDKYLPWALLEYLADIATDKIVVDSNR
jgi:hypothetical protein